MGKHKKPYSMSEKQILPKEEVQRNKDHSKTVSDLPEPDDLPITVLEKSIPKSALRDT